MKEINVIIILMTVMWITSTFLMWSFTNDIKTSVIGNIEKHSVHPIYGEYPQKLYNCYPWDSCKEKKR